MTGDTEHQVIDYLRDLYTNLEVIRLYANSIDRNITHPNYVLARLQDIDKYTRAITGTTISLARQIQEEIEDLEIENLILGVEDED